MQKSWLLVAIASIATLTSTTKAQAPVPTLKNIAEFDLPGPIGKCFDYLTIGSAYATPFHKLYVSDEWGKAEAIVDVTREEIVNSLHFKSETGMPQYDPVSRKV